MGIQQLTVNNFRSFQRATWTPGALNLVVGPNGSGKSNLLRCLEFISIAARGELERTFSERGLIPFLWNYSGPSLSWQVRLDPVDAERDLARDALTFELELKQVHTSGYDITKDSLGNWYKFQRKEEASPYWIYKRDSNVAMLFDQPQQRLVRLSELDSEHPEGYEPNESLLSQIADTRNRIPLATRRSIEGWNIFHDVHVEQDSPIRKPASAQFTKRLRWDASNLVTVMHTLFSYHREFKRQVEEGMSAAFGGEFEELVFQVVSAGQIQLAVQWRSSSQPHSAADLSDGTLRFLFLLTVLCNPEPASVIAIDEPEAGLHPSMLPILAEYAYAAAERSQVVMTSHSPEFLDAFTRLSPTVTICHWEAGESTLHTLPAGSLDVWLRDYRLGQLFTRGDLEALLLPAVEAVPANAGSPTLPSQLDQPTSS